MNYNSTLYDILQSELINSGKNEFVDNGKIVAFNPDYTFMKKVIVYDTDVEKITNEILFHGVKLDNPEHDKKFKKQFINRFLNHSFKYQTIEMVSNQIINTFMNNMDFLNSYYNDIDLFITGKSIGTGKNSSNSISDSRVADSTLPQSEVNINVDNTILDYADSNTISRMKDKSESNNNNENLRYNIESLEKSRLLLEQVFDDFENKCFMFTW